MSSNAQIGKKDIGRAADLRHSGYARFAGSMSPTHREDTCSATSLHPLGQNTSRNRRNGPKPLPGFIELRQFLVLRRSRASVSTFLPRQTLPALRAHALFTGSAFATVGGIAVCKHVRLDLQSAGRQANGDVAMTELASFFGFAPLSVRDNNRTALFHFSGLGALRYCAADSKEISIGKGCCGWCWCDGIGCGLPGHER